MWRRNTKDEAKWLAQFKRLGRGRVRYLAQKNTISPKQKQVTAERWLREQDDGDERRERWPLALGITAAIIALASLLVMLE